MRIAAPVLALYAAVHAPLYSQVPTQGERDRAMSYLHATRKQLLDTAGPLTPAQWKFKPVGGGWSVAEITEHLAVTEASTLAEIQLALRAPAMPDHKSETAGKDDLIMKGVPDRSHKAQSPESLAPTGRFATRDAALSEFKARRDQTIEFIEKTPADLRSHMFPHPALKLLDCYQWVLFLAAHADRHVQQMKEVIASPGFPKR